jgi:hypothetical protein
MLQCICGSEAPNTASCRGRSTAMKTWGGALAFQLGSGQWSGDTCTVQGSGDGLIGEPPWSVKLTSRTKSGGSSTQRTLHCQNPGPRPQGGTGVGLECYPLWPETHERIPSGTLWAGHAGDPTQCWTTTGSRHYLQPGQTWVTLNREIQRSSSLY